MWHASSKDGGRGGKLEKLDIGLLWRPEMAFEVMAG